MTTISPELQAATALAWQRTRIAALVLLLSVALFFLPSVSIALTSGQLHSGQLQQLLSALAGLLGAVLAVAAFIQWRRIGQYQQLLARLKGLLALRDIKLLRQEFDSCKKIAQSSALNHSAFAAVAVPLQSHLDNIAREHATQQLQRAKYQAEFDYIFELECLKRKSPLLKLEAELSSALQRLQLRRQQLEKQWAAAYAQFSWWDKLKYDEHLKFYELDSAIFELATLHRRLLKQHAADFEQLEEHFEQLAARAARRITTAHQQLTRYIAESVHWSKQPDLPLASGLFCAALSLPVSLWDDFTTAGDIYDTLRQVNGNFAGLSNSEIWLETLLMPSESLAGLISLTKGAYFEQLVAAETGGALFEHFNNPTTDIVIDGVAFQLKATDSVSYIERVAAGIPVIATSEVAVQTDAIDAGISNAELQHSVELALGGSVIDTKDTAIDTLLSGIGGLGVFATLQGINHAAERYNNGGDGVEALFEGAGVAIEGTARALVNTAELGYNLLNSRAVRFAGRTVVAGLEKLDKKMLGESDKKK